MSAPVSISDVSGVREALSILGLETDVRGDVDASTLKAAFRTAVKAARPDQAGGDAERFRRVIAAYRLIQAHQPPRPALSAPAARPAPTPVLVLSPMQALAGGQVEVRLGARTVRVTTPKGLRSGDHLRLRRGAADGSDLYLSVLIRPEDGLSVVGDDLFMTWAVERRLMADGGRRMLLRALRLSMSARARRHWLGLYGVEGRSDAQRRAFLARVDHELGRL